MADGASHWRYLKGPKEQMSDSSDYSDCYTSTPELESESRKAHPAIRTRKWSDLRCSAPSMMIYGLHNYFSLSKRPRWHPYIPPGNICLQSRYLII